MDTSFMVFTTERGKRYAFPAHIIAHARAKYYEGRGDSYEEEYEYTTSDTGELYEWAMSDMNWSDVAKYAVELPSIEEKEDLEGQWMNGNLTREEDMSVLCNGHNTVKLNLERIIEQCQKEFSDAI